MKKIKIAIACVLIIILILIIAIVYNSNLDNNNNLNILENNNAVNNLEVNNEIILSEEELEAESLQGSVEGENKQALITDSDYITLKNCVYSFLDFINSNSSTYYGGNGEKIVEDKEIKNISLQLLSKNYINKNAITINNIDKFIYNINKKVLFIPTKIIKFYELEQVNSFVIEGYLEDNNYEPMIGIKFILNMDTTNNTYSIEILNVNQNINNVIPDKLNEIQKNDYNTYQYTQLTETNIINEISAMYKKTVLGYPELFYNNYLNTDYRKNRFNNLEEFKKYVESNKDIIKKINIKKYKKISNDNGSTTYILEDQYENTIIVEYKSIVDYKVYLDTYTVELDTFKEEYNNSKNDESKLSLQLGKITQMLNNKDYNAIYNKLNETFRNNNFTNVSKLEEYLKNNIYNINSLVISECEENDDYYVCKATIINQENTNESKDINLIIKLIDSNNFEMSFSFEE